MQISSRELLWRLAQTDGAARVELHRKRAGAAPGGGAAEALRVRAVNASYVHAAALIEPTFAIDDLQLTVAVRADQPGIQLLARVILPHAPHPDTGRPLTTLIPGSRYQRAGQWQPLEVTNVQARINDAAKVLRARFGTPVDTTEAIIDMVVLDLYAGPGVHETWIDTPGIAGQALVPPSHAHLLQGTSREPTQEPLGDDPTAAPRRSVTSATFAQQSATAAAAAAASSVRSDASAASSIDSSASWETLAPTIAGTLRDGQLVVQQRPFFARAVTYRGEAPSRVANFGFNTLVFLTPPDAESMRLAASAGLWWMAAFAPESLGEQTDAALFHSRLIAWLRPATPYRSHLSTSAVPSEAALADWASPTLNPVHVAHVPLQPPSPARHQAELLLGRPVAEELLDLGELRYNVRRQLEPGCRGIWFQTQRPLHDIQRLDSLPRLHAELELVDPWLAGGQRIERASSSEFAVFDLHQSRLIIPRAIDRLSTAKPRDWMGEVPLTSDGTQSFRLTFGGLESVAMQRIPGGLRLASIGGTADSYYVMTSDQRVVQQLAERSLALGRRIADSEARRMLDRLQVYRQLPGSSRGGRVAQIEGSIARAERLARAGDAALAMTLLRSADEQIDGWEQSMLRQVIALDPIASASPCAARVSTLPAALKLTGTIGRRSATVNLLPSGDFEDVEKIVADGWNLTVQASSGDAARATEPFALTQLRRRSGLRSLRLTPVPASNASPEDSGVRPASFDATDAARPDRMIVSTLMSPAIECRQGDIVRLTGWIHDTQGTTADPGPLQSRSVEFFVSWYPDTPLARYPSLGGWRRLDHYLMAPADGPLRIAIRSTLIDCCVDQLEVFRYPAGND